MKVLVLGASGMLGNAVLRFFARSDGVEVFGAIRAPQYVSLFPTEFCELLVLASDLDSSDGIVSLLNNIRPDVVINCVGLVKQLSTADDPLIAIPVNSILPHRLARICAVAGARLIHISTDCVFSGTKGGYVESDFSDATDLYGRSKLLGEVDYPNAITLRTSIIGHELRGQKSLVGWFLAQQSRVKGFRRAIFSGLPTVELSRIIRDYVIPNTSLRGLYHVSAEPISKFELLSLISSAYGKQIEIEPDDDFVIDRSLDSTHFRCSTGYYPPSWSQLVNSMRDFQ